MSYISAVIRELVKDIEDAAQRYDDFIECECDDPDAGCWYNLPEDVQKKIVLDFIIASVAP